MRAPRTNIAGAVRAGRGMAETAIQTFDTARKYSIKPGEIQEAGLKARAMKERAVMQANARVEQSAKKAEGLIDRTQIKIDRDKSIRESKKQVRKAGLLGAAASAVGMALTPDIEPPRPEGIKYEGRESILRDRLTKLRAELDAGPKPYTPSKAGAELSETTAESGGASGSTAGSAAEEKAKQEEPPGKDLARLLKGSGTGLRLMNSLVDKGYSPVSAAAIAGNAAHESANFKAYEEYAPNAYGTKGVGFLQWTNAGEQTDVLSLRAGLSHRG